MGLESSGNQERLVVLLELNEVFNIEKNLTSFLIVMRNLFSS